MQQLTDYFSDDRIIRFLCKSRLKLAGGRNDSQYLARLSGHPRSDRPDPLDELLPPRSQWAAFRPRHRSVSRNPDLMALHRAATVLRVRVPEPPWAATLNRFIASIRERVLGSQPFVFARPKVRWVLKKGKEYRALCRFSLEDGLIASRFAEYLRDVLDPGFSSSSYAFRSPNSAGQVTTHHDAFNAVFNLRQGVPGQDLYVAECDIRGFFDTVHHPVALAAFELAARKSAQAGCPLDPRAGQIFQAYLNCYSFPDNVKREAEPLLQQTVQGGYFPWPEAALRLHHHHPEAERIGIPQGGAVSGIIANLILDAADKAVEAKQAKRKARIHYSRYCDDMVLISPVRRDCQSAFDIYLQKLGELRLPYHPPKRTWIYGPGHWLAKSKAPYRWSGRKWFGCVPWVQFVGYQVRYDGLVRPRKDSIARQANKLRETTDWVKFGLLEDGSLATRRQVKASLLHKLVAMGVGRIRGGSSDGPKPMCWASGFKALDRKPFIPGGLRFLDHKRQKHLRRLGNATIEYGTGRRNRQGRRKPVPQGYAYSYDAQFRNEGGGQLVRNPCRPVRLLDRGQAWLFGLAKRLAPGLNTCSDAFKQWSRRWRPKARSAG